MPRRSKNTEVAAAEARIENHVAARIRLRRGLLGMSQTDLAKALGITFQQVQKYERGSNRVSIGKLHQLCTILDVPLSFFFDGIDAEVRGAPRVALTGEAEGDNVALGRRELSLLRLWRAADGAVADQVLALLRRTAGENDDSTAGESPATSVLISTDRTAEHPAASAPKRRGRPPGSGKGAQTGGNRLWSPKDIR